MKLCITKALIGIIKTLKLGIIWALVDIGVFLVIGIILVSGLQMLMNG